MVVLDEPFCNRNRSGRRLVGAEFENVRLSGHSSRSVAAPCPFVRPCNFGTEKKAKNDIQGAE